MARKDVYKSIKKRLKVVIPSLALVDIQRKQIERGRGDYPTPLPACYISFSAVNWTSDGTRQYGDTNLIVDIYLDNHGDTYDTAENSDINAAELLTWCDTIYSALQGYWCDGMQPLNRVSEDTYMEDDYIHYQVQFNTLLIEEELDVPAKVTKPALVLDNRIVDRDKEARRGVGRLIVERNLRVQ